MYRVDFPGRRERFLSAHVAIQQGETDGEWGHCLPFTPGLSSFTSVTRPNLVLEFAACRLEALRFPPTCL